MSLELLISAWVLRWILYRSDINLIEASAIFKLVRRKSECIPGMIDRCIKSSIVTCSSSPTARSSLSPRPPWCLDRESGSSKMAILFGRLIESHGSLHRPSASDNGYSWLSSAICRQKRETRRNLFLTAWMFLSCSRNIPRSAPQKEHERTVFVRNWSSILRRYCSRRNPVSSHFWWLVLGCVNVDICNQIRVGKRLTRSKNSTLLVS